MAVKKKVAHKKTTTKKTKGKIVAKNVVERKSGYLYYIDGKGNAVETKMNRKGAKKGHKSCK